MYVTAHRCAAELKKNLNLRSGSQRHRHFVGFFNVPVLAPTRDHPFIRWFRHSAPFSRLLRSRWGYGGHILDFNPRAPTGGKCSMETTHKATEILFLVLRILFVKNRVGGRNKIKNKIFLQVPIHMEYWMSEILRVREWDWLFNVTRNDISVIYVTAHRCAGGLKKKLDLRSGSQRHRHFAGFFNVPVLAPTRDHPFYTVIPTHRPI